MLVIPDDLDNCVQNSQYVFNQGILDDNCCTKSNLQNEQQFNPASVWKWLQNQPAFFKKYFTCSDVLFGNI